MPQWLHEMVTPLLMLCVFMMNARLSFRRTDSRSWQESARLQQVLIEELKSLSQLYLANIDLLDRHEPFLMAPRAPMVIYRANIVRLHTLDPDLVADLIAIHNRNEQIEMLMQARAKAVRGGSATVFLFDEMDPAFQPILTEFEQQITRCIDKFGSTVASAKPAELSDPATSLVPRVASRDAAIVAR